MTTVDLTSINLAGDGPGTTQVYDYGTQGGENFTLTMIVAGSPSAGNPGGPFLSGSNIGGRTEFTCGNGPGVSSGIRVNRITLQSNRGLDAIEWGVYGIAGSGIEEISFISNGGSASGLGSGSLGTITWENLNGATEVYFEYSSNSDGNNMATGPIGDAELRAEAGGETYIIPGFVRLVGTGTEPGVFDRVISIADENGFVGAVPIRVMVNSGAGPVLTNPSPIFSEVGDVISLQIVSTNPQGLTLIYSAANLPEGLTINPATGLIEGTITRNGNYTGAIEVKDDFGECDTIKIEWQVYQGDPPDLSLLTPPTIVGLNGTTPGPWRELSPGEVRDMLLVYTRSQIDNFITALRNELRDGVIDELNTLKKLANAIDNRPDFATYITGLINNAGGGGDLTNVLSVLGVGANVQSLPVIGQIPAGLVLAALIELETRIPTGGGGLPDQAGETMLVRDQSTVGPPAAKNKTDTRSFLDVPSNAEMNSALAAKFDDSKGGDLITLTGRPANSTHFGTSLTDQVSDNLNLVDLINEILVLIQDLIDNGGGGGGSLTLPGERIAGNFTTTTGPATGQTAGGTRSFLDVPSNTEMNSAIDTAKDDLIDGAPSNLDTLDKLADSIGDDPDFTGTVQTALNAKAGAGVVNDLILLSGMPAAAQNHGTFADNILNPNQNTRQLLEQLGQHVKGIQAGLGVSVGGWVTPGLHGDITGQGFTSNGSGSAWGQISYRIITLGGTKHVEFKGCVRRPTDQGIGSGLYGVITLSDSPANRRTFNIKMVDDSDDFREATAVIETSGLVAVKGQWSGAKNIVINGMVPI